MPSFIRGPKDFWAGVLYVLVGGLPTLGDLSWIVGEALAGGAQVIQLREKGLSDREHLRRAREVRILTAQARARFILNDRPDLARLAGADDHQGRSAERPEQRQDRRHGPHRRCAPAQDGAAEAGEQRDDAEMQAHRRDHRQVLHQPGPDQQDVRQRGLDGVAHAARAQLEADALAAGMDPDELFSRTAAVFGSRRRTAGQLPLLEAALAGVVGTGRLTVQPSGLLTA